MKAVIICGRAFGDAIMTAFFLSRLERKHYNISFDIITKKEYKTFFANRSIVSAVSYLSFSYMYFRKNFGARLIKGCIKDYLDLRKNRMHYDYAIDLLGDFRERKLLTLLKVDKIYSIERRKGNQFNHLIHKGLSNRVSCVDVDENTVNFYEQMNILSKELSYGELYSTKLEPITVKRIGIHPFASQLAKSWSYKKWNKLISLLLYDGYKIVVFCAQTEKDIAISKIQFRDNVELVCENLKGFLNELSKVDLLVGLESFSIHAANFLNVPSISLVGSQNGNLWKSPTTEIIQGDTSCPYWPCYNKPKKCKYECINSISVNDVYKAIKVSERHVLV